MYVCMYVCMYIYIYTYDLSVPKCLSCCWTGRLPNPTWQGAPSFKSWGAFGMAKAPEDAQGISGDMMEHFNPISSSQFGNA